MKIKTAQLEQVIMTHALINQPVFIFGRPGVGKTQEIQRIGQTNFAHFIRMDGSQMPYEAIQGINYVSDGQMKNTPYPAIKQLEDMAQARTVITGKVFVMVDEVSSLEPDDQRTLLNIINDRVTPNGIKLDFDIMFVLAGNPAADQRGFASDNAEAAVNLVEQAIVTRCAVYTISYTVRDYIEYGEKNLIHPVVIKTLKEVPEVFDRYKDESYDSAQVVVPRTLNMLSDLIWASIENKTTLIEANFASYAGLDAPLFYDNYTKNQTIHIDFIKLINGDVENNQNYQSADEVTRGSTIIRGIRIAMNENIDLTEQRYDNKLKELIELLSPEYCNTIAQMMVLPEFQNYYLGINTNEYLGAVIETAKA